VLPGCQSLLRQHGGGTSLAGRDANGTAFNRDGGRGRGRLGAHDDSGHLTHVESLQASQNRRVATGFLNPNTVPGSCVAKTVTL
jgi:hypothetical protein